MGYCCQILTENLQSLALGNICAASIVWYPALFLVMHVSAWSAIYACKTFKFHVKGLVLVPRFCQHQCTYKIWLIAINFQWSCIPWFKHIPWFKFDWCPKKKICSISCELIGPRQANLVLIAYASSEGSGEPAHPRSLARTFAARSYKQWVKRNLQTESQIPGPSEWLGMRS